MTPEEGGEGWSGKMFFRAWTAGMALFPSSRRHSQKFKTGLIVAAFRSQIVDKMHRKTVSWQRVVQVRDGIVYVTVLRHRVDYTNDCPPKRVCPHVVRVEPECVLCEHRCRQIDGVTENQRCRVAVQLFGKADCAFQQLFGGDLVGTRQDSRDMHQRRGANCRFRTLRLFTGRQQKLL